MRFKESIKFQIKAGRLTCLFLFVQFYVSGQDNSYLIDSDLANSYKAALNLNWEQCNRSLDNYSGASDLGQIYVRNFAESLELFITEDPQLYDEYMATHDDRISKIKNGPDSPYKNLFLADLKLYFTIIQLKFGNQWSAAWNFRRAYNYIEKNTKQYPDFQFDDRTEGIIHIAVGITPKKYNWLLNLFGFEGTIEKGLAFLQSTGSRNNLFQFESQLLLAFINGHLLENPAEGIQIIEGMDTNRTDRTDRTDRTEYQDLVNYSRSLLLMKASKSEQAVTYLNRVDNARVPSKEYQLGKIYFQKGEFIESTRHFNQFAKIYSGPNYIKDTYYRLWLLSQFEEVNADSETLFDLANSEGQTTTEVDKNAAKNLKNPPNLRITEFRFAIDGGYFDRAISLSDRLENIELSSTKDSVELDYRRARLFHKLNDLEKAKELYLKTINMAGKENWYYAPNSALQMGYIFADEGRVQIAKEYFSQAISYNNHDYESSIENKARAAAAKLD